MRREFQKALFWRVLAILSGLACGVVSIKLYNQYLSAGVLAMFSVALQILNYMPVLDGGFRMAINRSLLEGAAENDRSQVLTFGQTIYVYLGLVAFAFGLAALGVLSVTGKAATAGLPFIFYVSLAGAGVISLLGAAQIGLLVGLRVQEKVYMLNAVNSLLMLSVLWVALWKGAGPWALPLSILAPSLATLGLGVRIIRGLEPTLRLFQFRTGPEFWSLFHRFKRDAWAAFRSQVSILLLFSVDLVMVYALCTAVEVFAYFALIRFFGIVRGFLQTLSEVAWPIIAQKRHVTGALTEPLLRINSWVYGAVMSAMAVTLPPFIEWYLGPQYQVSKTVMYLLAGRFLVTGLSSPAAYALVGLGEFRQVARYVERELVAAVVLGLGFGLKFGMAGVVAGFLIATNWGTFLPLFNAFARIQGKSLLTMVAPVWWRVAVSGGTGWAIASVLLPFWRGAGTVCVGMMAAGAAVGLGMIVSWVRLRFSETETLPRLTLQEILKRI